MTGPNGYRYGGRVGERAEGRDRGTITYPDGAVYTGQFADGQPVGDRAARDG